jgi:tetratricopeptide (TPR) repeat protein
MLRFRVPPPVRWLVVVPLFGATGCAMAPGALIPTPAERPALERRLLEHPRDVQLLTRLAAARDQEGRRTEAVELLTRALAIAPREPTAHFLLGVVREGLGDPEAAVAAYAQVLTVAPNSPLADQADGRLRLVRRQALRAAIRTSLAREAELAARPSPATVAVFPFQVDRQDTTLTSLARAMAEMLADDLALPGRLTIVERVQVQALLDEVALGASGAVDRTSAARGGRLLGAGRIVQGQLSGSADRLRVDAAVIGVGETVERATRVQEAGADRFFAMQAALTLAMVEDLGVSLTAAERERITRRPTQNLQALLAYGRGLEATDAGRFAEAATYFRQALRLDPGFRQAADRAAATTSMQQAASTPAAAAAATMGSAVEAAVSEEVAGIVRQATAAAVRNPAQEALGTEGVAKKPTVSLTLTLKRPGGTP